jgi:L-lactate dehydrogenase (cytochrome)
MKLSDCHNILDLRALAKRRLPSPMFHYLDGGADDEWTMRRNTAAFDDYELMPNCLNDISAIDLSTTLLGRKLAWPVFLSPTGMSRLFHHGAEPAVARAAAAAGTLYTLSTVATTSLEDIAATSDGPKMFQIYIFRDRGLTTELVQRCKAAKYHALCLTVDTPLAGNRERDRRTGMTLPPRFSLGSLWSFGLHPGWSLNLLLHPRVELANVAQRVGSLQTSTTSLIDYVNRQFDRTLSWRDVEWLTAQWNGPFVIKGLQSVADAKHAADVGATAVMVSNHGGRQLDGTPAPVDCIAAIVDAVGNRLEVILDGGVRRGTHVIKALALGAKACSIGRAYLYGLACGGQRGVEHALSLLRSEIERGFALLGCRSVGEVTRAHLIHRRSR